MKHFRAIRSPGTVDLTSGEVESARFCTGRS
jgi:hypothetical protein